MKQIETNIFEIKNLDELSCKYRLYRVKGIPSDSDDYEKNVHLLIDGLSRRKDCQSPCEHVFRNGETFIAQPEGYPELPKEYPLIRTIVKIERLPELKELNFKSLNPETSKLAIRFFQFALQNPLYNNSNLWQPKAGHPFFNKAPDRKFRELSDKIDLYRGFTLRVVFYSEGKLGVCVDASSKYVARDYIPANIDRNEFKRKYKGHHCLYEYGDRWYEVKIYGLSDLDVTETTLPDRKTLLDHVHDIYGRQKSVALNSLPKDCAVLLYKNNRNEDRNMPSGLCRLTYTTNHESIRKYHKRTIKSPDSRRKEIRFIVDANLRNLKFGNVEIKLSKNPFCIPEEKIFVPDLEFGNKKVLSLRQTPGTIHTNISDFGKKKMELIYSNESGIFRKKQFDRQYIILPQSIHETFGYIFVEDLKREVNRLFQDDPEIEYSPIVIPYNDSVQRSVYRLGRQVLDTLDKQNAKPGFGIVMIPKLPSKHTKKEDELGNLIMSELRKKGIFTSIIHTEVSSESYEYNKNNGRNGSWALVSDFKQQGKYKGYLKNVALNKILLLNSFWPFVLKTQLNADLTIGIDVKGHTAGFTIVYKSGSKIRFEQKESNQKEQLSRAQIRSILLELLREEEPLSQENIKNVVIHRDGILYSSEREGIKRAFEVLANEGKVDRDVRCTFLEIKKSSRMPFRMFRIVKPNGLQREIISNPSVGTYISITENDYFICNTGYPFNFNGTTNPLHILKVEGNFPPIKILEDVFYLSNLTWTKLDDCSRFPLTIKMADIRLRESSGEYDKDALEFGED